jgi:hypothetical protein
MGNTSQGFEEDQKWNMKSFCELQKVMQG